MTAVGAAADPAAWTDRSRLLDVRALTKAFPGVVAVDGVDLAIAPGEIVALLGQNGAGKSTLIQVLCGLHPYGTYAGEIVFNGEPLRAHSVADAEAAGIAFLAQEINTAPELSVAEGLFLNNEPQRFGLIDRPLQLARAKSLLQDFGLDIDPTAPLGSLDLASQQLVSIVRALSRDARLVILDEPTAALTEREASRLFDRMRALRARGVAIIFVSHRLAEVFQISDRIVIMRDGRVSGTFTTAETSRDAVVDQMIGSGSQIGRAAASRVTGRLALEARGLTVFDTGGREVVSQLDLALRHGEIVGLFGLLGSGAIETTMALFGAWRGQSTGDIVVDGRLAEIRSPSDATALGIGLVAQDRRDGLSGGQSIYENAILADLRGISSYGFLDAAGGRRRIIDLFDRLHIKAGDIDVTVGTLSGGNQQKVQVARWLAANARILLLVDPTRGVDVGARAEIQRIWAELAGEGAAILLVSSEAEEIVQTCDRAVVLRGGRIAGSLDADQLSEGRLLRLATGV